MLFGRQAMMGLVGEELKRYTRDDLFHCWAWQLDACACAWAVGWMSAMVMVME